LDEIHEKTGRFGASNLHDFALTLKDGEAIERRIAWEIMNLLSLEALPRVTREEQREGKDIDVSMSFDVKIRDNKYYNKGLLFETKSVVEEGVLGWVFTSKSNGIIYGWWNIDKTALAPQAYILRTQPLKNWLSKHAQHYLPKQTMTLKGDRTYHTEFIIVPTIDVPRDICREIINW